MLVPPVPPRTTSSYPVPVPHRLTPYCTVRPRTATQRTVLCSYRTVRRSCDNYDYATNGTMCSPTSTFVQRPLTAAAKPTPAISRRLDGRVLNKGSKKRLRYTMQFKYDMSEQCDEAIHDSSQPLIKNATNYFNAMYTSHDIAHKWICMYGKWNKAEHRARMINVILGKDFECSKKVTRSPFHHMDNLLYNEVLTKRVKSHRVSNTFICLRALVLFQQLKEQEIPVYKDTIFKA